MPPKDMGPLISAQKEADVLKKKVAQLIKESNKTLDNRKLKDKEDKLKELYKNCLDLKQDVTVLLEKVKSLTEDQEPKTLKRYAAMKNQEVNRITVWQNQLTDTMGKLLPNEIEEEYLKKLKKETEEGSEATDDKEEEEEDEEEDEEEEDEDDEEEEEEEKQPHKDKNENSKPSTKPEKAKVKEEEEEEEDEDEEEESEEEESEEEEKEPEKKTHPKDKEKDVPHKGKPDAKVKKDEEESVEEEEESEEEEEEDDEEEEDEEEEESASEEGGEEGVLSLSQQLNQFITTAPFVKEQEDDLGFVKGEILNIIEMKGDWWIGENEKGKRGNVPANLLQKYNKYITIQKDDEEEEEEEEEETGAGEGHPRKKRHGKALWGSIKKAVTETTVSDVLHAMGAVPSGFRMSTLSKCFNEGDAYRMINYLNPKLSVSNLMYKDLFFDPLTSKIRPRKVKIERIVTLVSCQQIPHPGSGIKLLGRHVRICLFDGQNILSNIHTVKVSDKNLEERTWFFSTKIFEKMNVGEHGETFIRTNGIVDNIGILFELGISYIRESTEQKDEFSCGWVHLPLLDQDGAFVANRTFNLYVNGGTPYEKGVEVDPSISRRTSTNAFVSLISGNKQPRLVVRISLPKTEQKTQLDSLPDTLVGNMALLPFYSYFRQIMADVLLRDRVDLDSTELVHSPLLATFPGVSDEPDLMKLLRDAWVERLKTVERAQKRDEEYMKNLFKQVFMENVYPLVHTVLLPKYKSGDTDIEQKRHEQICHFIQIRSDRKTAVAALLSSELIFTPFSIREVSFSVIGSHCMARHIPTTAVEG